MIDFDFEDSAVNVDSVPDELSSTVQPSRSTGGVSRHRTPTPCASHPPSRQSSIYRSPTPFSSQSPSPRLSPALSHQSAILRSPTPWPFHNPGREQTPADAPRNDGSNMVEMSVQGSADQTTRTGPTSVTDGHACTATMAYPVAASRPPVSAQDGVVRPADPSQVPIATSPQAPTRRQTRTSRRNVPTNAMISAPSEPAIPAKRQLEASGRKDKPTKTLRTSSMSNAPAWFKESKGLFDSEGLGSDWGRLLAAWEMFEDQEGYKDRGKLLSKGRPDIVHMWISRARSTTWRPSIKDPKAYGVAFDAWWVQLQPRWRISADGAVNSQLLDGNWDCLRRPGLNGLQSVVAALFYWGIAARSGGARKSWLSAVLQCLSVFRCLLRS